MKDLFYHKGPYGINFFGIRLSGWDFFTLFSISFYDYSWRECFTKFYKFKIGFFFNILPLPTSQIRHQAMRRN